MSLTWKVEMNKLTKQEQLEVQNIMLRIAYEEEHVENLELKINNSKKKIAQARTNLEAWNKKIDKKLQKHNLSINEVNINADTGEITPMRSSSLRAINE
jgi:dihydroxyacid dehydratase/phosphogluconate dehydratase